MEGKSWVHLQCPGQKVLGHKGQMQGVGWGRGLHPRAQILPHVRAISARGMTESPLIALSKAIVLKV